MTNQIIYLEEYDSILATMTLNTASATTEASRLEKKDTKEIHERRAEERSIVLYQNGIQDNWREGEVVDVPNCNWG